MNPLLLNHDPFPELLIRKDPFAKTEYGDDCTRYVLMRKSDRLMTQFEVPIYKTTAYRRRGLFRWDEIEITDWERIEQESLERGKMYAQMLLEHP